MSEIAEFSGFTVYQLRAEAKRLKSMIDTEPICDMKRIDAIARITIYRKLFKLLTEEEKCYVKCKTKPSARKIPTETQKIDGDCDIVVPKTPLEKTAPIPPKD